jgi:hypothetical protein
MTGELIALLIFGCLILFGMAGTGWWVHSYGMRLLGDAQAEAKDAAGWSRTLARVTRSAVRDRRYRAGRYTVVKAVPDITYRYDVEGRSYEGTRIRFGIVEFNLPRSARKLTDLYHEGAVVPVLYDPRHPSRSVIEPHVHLPAQKWIYRGVALFLALGGLAIGGLMIWAALRDL